MQNGKFTLLVLSLPAALGTKNEALSCEAALEGRLYFIPPVFPAALQVVCWGLAEEGSEEHQDPALW